MCSISYISSNKGEPINIWRDMNAKLVKSERFFAVIEIEKLQVNVAVSH